MSESAPPADKPGDSDWSLAATFQTYASDNLYHLGVTSDSPETASCKKVELVLLMGSSDRAQSTAERFGEKFSVPVKKIGSGDRCVLYLIYGG